MCNLINTYIHTYISLIPPEWHRMTRMTGPDCVVMCNLINTYIHTSLIPPWEDQRKWHRMTRMTRPDCADMCNLINIHTYIHTYMLPDFFLFFFSLFSRPRAGLATV